MPPIYLSYARTTFESDDLASYIHNTGRDYIIQGQKACTMDMHPKTSSLDYWLRGLVPNRDTKQAVNEVIGQLVATGDFEEGRFMCLDSGRMCKGIRLAQ